MKNSMRFLGVIAVGLLTGVPLGLAGAEGQTGWYENTYYCKTAWWPMGGLWPALGRWNSLVVVPDFVDVTLQCGENQQGFAAKMASSYGMNVKPKVFGIYRRNARDYSKPSLELVKIVKRQPWQKARMYFKIADFSGRLLASATTISRLVSKNMRNSAYSFLPLVVGVWGAIYGRKNYSTTHELLWAELPDQVKQQILDHWESIKPDDVEGESPTVDDFSRDYVLVTSSPINARLAAYHYAAEGQHYCLVHAHASPTKHHDRDLDNYYFWGKGVSDLQYGSMSSVQQSSRFLIIVAPDCKIPLKKFKEQVKPDINIGHIFRGTKDRE